MSEYIERGALLEWLDKVDGVIADGTVEAPTLYKQVITDIKQFPAADVAEVKHGRWVHDTNNLYGCSECMERETMSPKKMKTYCPNCGCKMDGGADNG